MNKKNPLHNTIRKGRLLGGFEFYICLKSKIRKKLQTTKIYFSEKFHCITKGICNHISYTFNLLSSFNYSHHQSSIAFQVIYSYQFSLLKFVFFCGLPTPLYFFSKKDAAL